MTRRPLVAALLLVAALSVPAFRITAGEQAHAVGPVIVVETEKGTFWFQTFPGEAPATVEHIVALVRSRFYDGQRVHRALPGFVVQFGDPQSRDLGKQDLWGRGAAAASGKRIGIAEITKRRRHRAGAVAIAHMGDPANADSQIYVTLADRPDLDGYYAVFGQVISGGDVPGLLEVGDLIVKADVANR